MPDLYRIQIYWAPRREDTSELGRALSRTLTALGELHPELRDFRFDREDSDVSIGDAQSCSAAIEEHAVAWEFGGKAQTAYEIGLYVARAIAPPLSLRLTCGIEPLPLEGLFTPNRIEIMIRGDAAGLAEPEIMQAMLMELAQTWRADFGHAGGETHPPVARPLLGVGIPPVGWMTFLSQAFPALPAKLPTPAVAYPVASVGTIVVAHPELYRAHKKEHRAAVDALERALNEGGVLPQIPTGEKLEAQPPS